MGVSHDVKQDRRHAVMAHVAAVQYRVDFACHLKDGRLFGLIVSLQVSDARNILEYLVLTLFACKRRSMQRGGGPADAAMEV